MPLYPKLVSKPFGQLVRVCVRQDAKIRTQRALHGGFADSAALVGCYAFRHFPEHPLFGSRPYRDVVGQNNVPEEIRALPVFPYGYFLRMQFQLQFLFKKISHGWQQILQVFFISRHGHKVVGVAGVPFDAKRVFYKVIELAHVDIRKHLRGEIADGDALALGRRVAFHNFCQKPKRVSVSNSLLEDAEQNGMINGVKKLPYVALQHPALFRSIFALGSEHISYALDPFMCALAHAAGERGRDKGRFKNWIDYSKNGVVQDAVPHRRLVYPAALWVVHPKSVIRPVLVCFVAQVAAQLKNMLFDLLLKLGNIRLVPLVAFEYFPCRKEVLCGNY